MKKSEIKQHFREKREEIDGRLKEFKNLKNASEERKFLELVFVILSSRTDAEKSWTAAVKLEERNLLLSGDKEEISRVLKEENIQYPEEKAEYILENRKMLSQPTLAEPSGKLKINSRIDDEDLEWTRKWLVENIKGISWKGASHFLRNIGYGDDFAIISNHISSQMHELGILEESEPPRDREKYLEAESRLQNLSRDLEIDLKALDLVLWSMKTGKIFK